jgi:outer membrane biosynthesis protein TonB
MRKVLQSTLLLIALAAPALAQTSTDFYLTLLRRGTAEVEAGRHADATANLRLAAFGLLESIEHYQTAQAYLAVAFDRLGQTQQAREAAQRVVAAERVERKFRSIALPAPIRTAFDAVAKKVLTASDVAVLGGGAIPATTTTAPPVVVDRVDVQTETRKPATEPAPKPAPVQTTTPKPQPPAPKPEPATPMPQPVQPQNTQPAQPQTTQPARPQNTQPAQPQSTQTTRPQNTQPQTTQRSVDVAGQFAAAERALSSANIPEARRIYRELLGVTTLDHRMLIRLAEGFYRSRDFANALVVFDRAGGLRPGEEPYRYYIAVAAYELGQYDRARRELAAALPFIEQTPDVQRYRVRIEGAR